MKAKRLELEQRVIELYLTKQIPEFPKEALLTMLAKKNKETILSVEALLNDPDCSARMRYMDLLRKERQKWEIKNYSYVAKIRESNYLIH